MRFSDKRYIQIAKEGVIPKIFRDSLAEAVALVNQSGKSEVVVVDLCSGIGVLGYLVTKIANKPVKLISLESNPVYCEGIADLGIKPVNLEVRWETLNDVLGLLESADIIIGRRCLPEMFSTDPRALKVLCNFIIDKGKRFVGEGRQLRGTSKHPLKSVDEEIRFFQSCNPSVKIIKKNNIYIL